MRLHYFVLIFITTFFIACEGPTGPNGKDGVDGINGTNGNNGENGGYDKQLRLYFNGYWITNGSAWELLPSYTHLLKFNKLNYVDVDSIIFVATLREQDGNPNNTCQVKLFNVTDNADIVNTQLEATGTELVWRESGNIFSVLPSKEITLGIMIKSSDGSSYVEVLSLIHISEPTRPY